MLLRFFLFSSFLTVLSVFSAPKFINTESTLIGEQQEGRISISSGSTAADGEFATGLKKFSTAEGHWTPHGKEFGAGVRIGLSDPNTGMDCPYKFM